MGAGLPLRCALPRRNPALPSAKDSGAAGAENCAQKGRPSPPVSCCMVEEASFSAARRASFTAATIRS